MLKSEGNMPKKQSDFYVKFWGVRGSIPTPGKDWVKYGGNTSCVQVVCDDQIFIIDMGSGSRGLGVELAQTAPVEVNIMISHYHWDHIMGIPFFSVLYDPRNTINFYGEGRKNRGLKSILAGQMKYPYFPVGLEVFLANLKFNTIAPGEVVKKGKVKIKTAALNHPQSSLAYRIEYKGKSVVYCSDNEHQDEMPKNLEKLIRGTDLLIYDAAYTDDEYTGRSGSGSKVGWGHSTWDEAINTAKHLKVKKLFIFHHDPLNTDKVVDRLVRECRKDFKELYASKEGLKVDLL
jgi:phosphoribosyl 1,2-cyclic phosphodiesterase